MDEQRRLNAAVVALLERSVAALAGAEAKNRTLHKLGLQAVEAWRIATPEGQHAGDEPFFGIASVRLEDQAETLRQALDAQRSTR